MVETHRGLCSPGVIRKGFLEEAMFAWRPVGRIAVDQAERERGKRISAGGKSTCGLTLRNLGVVGKPQAGRCG